MKTAVAVFLLAFTTAIVGGFVFYRFSFSVTEKMKTTFPARALQLETYDINETCLRVYVRNYASLDVQVNEVYTNEHPCNLQPTTIAPNEISIINLKGSYMRGETYVVKMFLGLGFPLVFNVEYR